MPRQIKSMDEKKTPPPADKPPVRRRPNATKALGNPPAAPAARHLVSVAQAADYVGCATKTIRRRVSEGTLTAYRFGPRMLRVDLAELDALLRPVVTAGTSL